MLGSSPPRKLAKMNEGLPKESLGDGSPSKSPPRALLSPRASLMMQCAAPPPPAPSGHKRLGLATGTQHSTVKKLTLKPKARTTTAPDPTTYLNQATTTLSRAARAILTSTPAPESLQALYTLCEQCVQAGSSYSATLYDKLRLEIERAASSIRRKLASEQSTATNHEWLQLFETLAKEYTQQILLIRSVFLYLDRTYVLGNKELLPIWDLGLDLFRQSVLRDGFVAKTITGQLLPSIKRDRDGDRESRQLTKSVIDLIRTIATADLYNELLWLPLSQETQAYYDSFGQSLAEELALKPSQWLKEVDRALIEETNRAEAIYGSAHKPDVTATVLDRVVVEHVQEVVDKSLATMIIDKSLEDIASMYKLLTTGLEIVLDKDADDKMVDRLVDLRRQSMKIVRDCCDNELSFMSAISTAYQTFINKRENKPAEQMAKFIDQKMRSGNKALDDDELEHLFGDVLFLFRFTQGKDMFEAFYKRDLAKRLLLNKSASFDAERSMLLKLKDECGAGFTSKLEIMFKDIELSDDIMRAYNGALSSSSNPSSYNFDLHVNVLSQGNWPTYPPTTVALPTTMSAALERFKAFYTSKYSGRTLSWVHALDTCTLKAQFPKGGKKELSVSLFQAVILLLFNTVAQGQTLSYKEIVESTRIEPKECKRLLQSLACGKIRVLQKHPKGRDVNDEDQFAFNDEFKDDRIRLRINQIQQTATVEENKATEERVFTDRSSHLQLAIVRVMEIVQQIGSRFKVEPAEIKKNISSLIDREYMRRADGELNVFEYVA
ncbi:hypothetical protein OIV83_002226 [Microbotryomycetes sp. JL201]|nr:hypothetical protein OIV83_002226 [Microbotryomycetes sp. JL201]